MMIQSSSRAFYSEIRQCFYLDIIDPVRNSPMWEREWSESISAEQAAILDDWCYDGEYELVWIINTIDWDFLNEMKEILGRRTL